MATYVKCREVGTKRFAFITPRSGLNYLRVHAARFESPEKAQAFIDENAPDNPEWEWKVSK